MRAGPDEGCGMDDAHITSGKSKTAGAWRASHCLRSTSSGSFDYIETPGRLFDTLSRACEKAR